MSNWVAETRIRKYKGCRDGQTYLIARKIAIKFTYRLVVKDETDLDCVWGYS